MIRVLPEALIREIAAGEVVAGPVDVVRELLENALDSGATRVSIELRSGGIDQIVVQDNGIGIPRSELPLAIESHATSKLEDLYHISTLGFRGEGLWAICQAAKVKLTSRPAQQLGGATLTAHQDAVSVEDRPAPPGTRVEVSHLFQHLPARRRSLESPASEARKVLALLSRYLLHRPNLAVKLVVDGEEKIAHAGGGFVEVARLLWGPVTANRLLSFKEQGDTRSVEGLLSRPELSRPRRDRLHLAINGRPAEWLEPLSGAIQAAYRELLPAGQYPVGIINLDLPLEEVLVNTSPDKSKVRLLNSEPVVGLVSKAVQNLLTAHPLARSMPEPTPMVGPAPASGVFPKLQHLGTYRELYLLAEAEGELYVVDQHAAHERIVFEELERRYRSEPPLELGDPEILTLTPDEELAFLERAHQLEEAGLSLESFGPGRYRVRSVPAFLTAYPSLVSEVIRSSLTGMAFGDAWRSVLARLACLPAIKAGHVLSGASAQALLDALAGCSLPWVCPHGRPTALVLSELELARRFGRRGVRAIERANVKN